MKSEQPKKLPTPRLASRIYDREAVMLTVCEELKNGRSLESICAEPGMPHITTLLAWVEDDPQGIGLQYARARKIGYALLAEEIIKLSDKTHEWVDVQETDAEGQPLFREDGTPVLRKVLMPLSADVIAHKRLQIDTRKWMLSKMLPKVYGDKVTQEHTGTDGGPITLAAVDLRKLSDAELEQMQTLLSKTNGNPVD